MIGTTREPIGDGVELALDVLDVEVEVGDDILPSRLTAAQLRLSLEVLQRLVIGLDDDLELRAAEVVTPRARASG